MEPVDNGDKLKRLALIEERAELALARRFELVERIGRITKTAWTLLVAIIVATAGATTAWVILKSQVDAHSKAIRTLWKHCPECRELP